MCYRLEGVGYERHTKPGGSNDTILLVALWEM